MVPGNIAEVKEKVLNEEKRFSDGKHYRPSLLHNIVNIAIGTTISYIDDKTKISSLIPFGYAGRKDHKKISLIAIIAAFYFNHLIENIQMVI